MIRIFAFKPGMTKVQRAEIAELPGLLEDASLTLWIDVLGRGPEEEALLVDTLKLHSLVVEDIFQDAPTPKIEEFDDYLYIVVHGIDRWAEQPDQLNTVELDIVVGKRWVLTHHDNTMRSVEAVESEVMRSPRIMTRGTTFVAHALLDHLTDHYSPLMDRFDDDIEALETQILDNPQPHHLERIFSMKRSLQRIRRVSVHQKEILQKLARGEFDQIDEAAMPFFRDIYDHFVRITDLSDGYRELVGAVLEMYLSMQSQRMNEIMKVLTQISTIMLPLTFIAGIYGMNFELMPELKWRYGYPFAIVMMLAIAGAFVWYFKRKRWL